MFFCSAWSERDRVWPREAPQVIVEVPRFLFLQAVTQFERCDEGNMAAERGRGKLRGGGGIETKDCSEKKQEEKRI